MRQKAFIIKAAATSSTTTRKAVPQNYITTDASNQGPVQYKTQTRDRVQRDQELDEYLTNAMKDSRDVNATFTFARNSEQEKLFRKMEEGKLY